MTATNVEESHENLSNLAEMVNATLKLNNEKIEEDVNQIEKMVQKKEKTTTTDKVAHKIHVTHRHKKSGKRKSKHSSYDQNLKELEHLLEKALETFKCDENTEESTEKTFVTYPVTGKENHQSIADFDNSITEENCGCNSTKSDGKKFSNDLDDLVTVVIGVMDQPQTVTKSLQSNHPLTSVPTEVQEKSRWFPTNWIMVPFSGGSPSIPSYLDNSKGKQLGLDSFCHKCGRKHLGGNFCSHCGTPVHHHSPSFCPLCKKLDD